MKIVELSDTHVRNSSLWSRAQGSVFCLDGMRAYGLEYFGPAAADHSFAVVDAERCIALCWLSGAANELSFWGRPAWYLWDERVADAKGLHKLVWDRIEALKIPKLRLLWDPGMARLAWPQLTGQVIHNEGIIPLDWAEDKILQSFRKSYRSLINWGKKELTSRILDRNSFTLDEMRAFMLFHQRVAGRVTRSERSWELQYEMVKEGQGFVILSEHKGNLVSACLVLHSQTEAHYAVGVYDRALMGENLPLGHYPLWLAVTHARGQGLKRFNLGDVGTGGGDKDRAIALFKRGFAIQIEATVVANYEWSAASNADSDTP